MISNHQLAVRFCHGAPVLGFFQQFKNFTVNETKANPVVLMENVMANVKQGNLTRPPQWWKHSKDWKRVFWKAERKAQQRDVKERLNGS